MGGFHFDPLWKHVKWHGSTTFQSGLICTTLYSHNLWVISRVIPGMHIEFTIWKACLNFVVLPSINLSFLRTGAFPTLFNKIQIFSDSEVILKFEIMFFFICDWKFCEIFQGQSWRNYSSALKAFDWSMWTWARNEACSIRSI